MMKIKLKPIDNASKNWHRFWSMRFIMLSAFGQIIVDLVPYLDGFIPHGTFLVLTVLAGVSRMVQQEDVG
jgi:hypothetical protein